MSKEKHTSLVRKFRKQMKFIKFKKKNKKILKIEKLNWKKEKNSEKTC